MLSSVPYGLTLATHSHYYVQNIGASALPAPPFLNT